MSGPAWECPPERLASGRIVYRCNYGHMHSNTTAAWSCDGPVRNPHIFHPHSDVSGASE